ncbi:hypothetical protein H9W95_10110 [Flavobacterium lindanitolerans]|nr:hypothetical protein [Flavobacterium lindanitolerans]
MTNFTTLKTIDLEKTGIRKLSISDILEILGDVPQSEGLHVYMGKGAITTIPFPYPYRSDNFSVMLILSGTMKLQLDLISHTANPNDLIIISPRTINHILEIGGNLELIAVSFTLDFARNPIGIKMKSMPLSSLLQKPSLSLPLVRRNAGILFFWPVYLCRKTLKRTMSPIAMKCFTIPLACLCI